MKTIRYLPCSPVPRLYGGRCDWGHVVIKLDTSKLDVLEIRSKCSSMMLSMPSVHCKKAARAYELCELQSGGRDCVILTILREQWNAHRSCEDISSKPMPGGPGSCRIHFGIVDIA